MLAIDPVTQLRVADGSNFLRIAAYRATTSTAVHSSAPASVSGELWAASPPRKAAERVA